MQSVLSRPYLWRTTTSRVRDYPVFNCQPTAYPGQVDCGVTPRDTNGWSHTAEAVAVLHNSGLPRLTPVHLTPAHLPVPKFAGVTVRWLSYMAAPCRHPLLARWHRGAVVFGGAWRVPQATRALPGSVLAAVTRDPRLLSSGAVAVRWVWMGRAPCAPGPILRGLQWHLHLTLGLRVAWVRGCFWDAGAARLRSEWPSSVGRCPVPELEYTPLTRSAREEPTVWLLTHQRPAGVLGVTPWS